MGKWFALLGALLGLAACAVKQPSSHAAPAQAGVGTKPLAQIHFSGAQSLQANTDLQTLRDILQLPQTIRLRDQALGSLATNAARGWAQGKRGAAGVSPTLIRPLLDDLYNFESHVEVCETQDGPPLCLLAVRAPREAAQRWSTNLWQAASSAHGAQPKAATLNGLNGWQVQQPKSFFGLFAKGEWTLVASGPSAPRDAALINTISKGSAAKKESFLSIILSDRGLAQIPSLRSFAGLNLQFTAEKDAVRTKGKLDLAQAFNGKITPWKIPTNTIRQPLFAFTAFNGASAWLSNSAALARLPVQRWPEQLFVWSERTSPFSVSAAANVGDATNFVRSVHKTLVPEWNKTLKENAWGEWSLVEEPLILGWRGLPIAIPFFRPAVAGDDGFVQIGFFPASPGKDPVPAELLGQIQGRSDLLMYDWEITEGRLFQLRPLRQLHLMATQSTIPDPQSAGESWLEAIQPKLGNTITEVTLGSPKTLNVTRKSHVGLSAAELTTLALWLQNTNFPALQLDLTGGPVRRPSGKRPLPGAPQP
ncbi:MAG TPA: hypothetical protein VEH27_08750 [Methylomirabilota bacterium]|nr:hypothetical protein [Methylomirabilota bacterium]